MSTQTGNKRVYGLVWSEPLEDDITSYVEGIATWAASKPQPVEPFKVPRTFLYGRRCETVPAKATIESITGRKALCTVEVAGTLLPVELPARVLLSRDLKVGMRFLWWMSQDGSVAPQDIDDLPQNRLSQREIEEGKRLSEELREYEEAGNDWVEYQGDGR